MNATNLASEYFAQFESAEIILPVETASIVARILAHKYRYIEVSNSLLGKVPWFVVAIIHSLECDLNFNQHLFNGDPLSARTVNEPVGQPQNGAPPFRWEFSAACALKFEKIDRWDVWDVAGICFCLESYNGWGYRKHGIPSPYLWSGSNQYTRGKFSADGRFDPTETSREIGGAVLLKYLTSQDIVSLPAKPVMI